MTTLGIAVLLHSKGSHGKMSDKCRLDIMHFQATLINSVFKSTLEGAAWLLLASSDNEQHDSSVIQSCEGVDLVHPRKLGELRSNRSGNMDAGFQCDSTWIVTHEETCKKQNKYQQHETDRCWR